jgi:hypothetical protein
MPKLCIPESPFLIPIKSAIQCIAVLCLAFCSSVQAQNTYIPKSVSIDTLPKLMARSHDPSDVLLTSLDTIVHDREVCCGKDSALEDSAQRADPASLQDVAAKLQGRHLLSDGRPIMMTPQYTAPAAINGSMLIEALRQKHAMLVLWKSHLYVLYGATFVEDYDPKTGTALYNIVKLLLIDTRYSDSRRTVEFNRATDDWSKVQGVLWITSAPQ